MIIQFNFYKKLIYFTYLKENMILLKENLVNIYILQIFLKLQKKY